MCGIAGIWNYYGAVPAEVRLQSMLQAMVHRGPDGSGMHAFSGGAIGMVRLALVDLSPRGNQPMWSQCGRVGIVFNGEIYNFREVRRRLEARGYVFRTTTDTEVILALYLEHGLDFVDQLRGMYAIVLFDRRETGAEGLPVVTLVRGPCGIKPLYVAEIGSGAESTLIFASELRAMLASGLVAPRVSEAGLNDYLRLGCVTQPRTMLDGVRMLGPGTFERFTPGRPPVRHRFWSMPAYAPKQESFEEAAERLREVLYESIRLHALADAPMGAYLSGGIDSTAIVALMRPHVSRLNTYTFCFPDIQAADETTEAAETARRLDCNHHVVEITGRDALASLPLFAEQIDQPSIDGINTWLISRAAAHDVKGVLSGVGGDEWFSGYPVVGRMLRTAQTSLGRMRSLLGWAAHYLHGPSAELKTNPRLDAAASYRSPVAQWTFPHSVFSPHEVDALTGRAFDPGAWRRQESELREVLRFAGGRDWTDETPLGMACLLDSYVFLMCRLLRDSDAAGMASSLELRVPLVDVKVIEFSRSCRDEYKLNLDDVRQKQSKRLLMHALRDVLPPAVGKRPKRGFNVPNEIWLRRELAPLVDDTCDPTVVRRRGWFDPALVQRLMHLRKTYSQPLYPRLWALMTAELWARAVLDRPAPSFSTTSGNSLVDLCTPAEATKTNSTHASET